MNAATSLLPVFCGAVLSLRGPSLPRCATGRGSRLLRGLGAPRSFAGDGDLSTLRIIGIRLGSILYMRNWGTVRGDNKPSVRISWPKMALHRHQWFWASTQKSSALTFYSVHVSFFTFKIQTHLDFGVVVACSEPGLVTSLRWESWST